MEAFCREESNEAALESVLFSMVESLVSEVVLAAEKSLLCLLLLMGSMSTESGVLSKADKLIKGTAITSVRGSKGETMPEIKDDGESDDDDDEGEDDDDGGDQDDDGGEEDFSGKDGSDEGDEDDDHPKENAEGGSEEEDDDGEDDDDEDDDDDKEDEDEDEEEEDEDEEDTPPSKRRK